MEHSTYTSLDRAQDRLNKIRVRQDNASNFITRTFYGLRAWQQQGIVQDIELDLEITAEEHVLDLATQRHALPEDRMFL